MLFTKGEVLMVKENLIGKRFGKLLVVGLKRADSRGASWLCRCDCGNEVVLCTSYLIGTKTRRPNRSCGCSHHKQAGLVTQYPRLYGIWKEMIKRCYDQTADNYERYGGKGTTVCDEWKNSFHSFLFWALNNGYKDGLTIDRIDNNKPYQPDNCRWVNYFIQAQNKGMNKRNKTGVTGVCRQGRNRYRAYIMRNGKRLHLGCFDTLQEAVQARKEAEAIYLKTGTL
mgnify:CR=1 FL=1